MKQPINYIHTKWEKINNYPHKQPIKYCNNTELTSNIIENFKNIFNEDFNKASKKSYTYNKTLLALNTESNLWKNIKAKEQAFEVIYKFILNGGSGDLSSITPLLPFEIFMLNDGFKMLTFCELNAINPGNTIVAQKYENNTIINPMETFYGRSYKKEDNIISISFGMEKYGREILFYFKTTKSKDEFEIDNSYENYNKAIEGLLKPI